MAALDRFDEQLAEQVVLYPNLYDPGHKFYKNQQVNLTSWREIALKLDIDAEKCRYKWKQLRDRFVRASKKAKCCRNGDAGHSKTQPLLESLSWLEDFVKHKTTELSYWTESPECSSSGPRELLNNMVNPGVQRAQTYVPVSHIPAANHRTQEPFGGISEFSIGIFNQNGPSSWTSNLERRSSTTNPSFTIRDGSSARKWRKLWQIRCCL